MKQQKGLTINIRGELRDFSTPWVMGILNATPDSFFGGCRAQSEADIAARVRQIRDEGADCIDVGGCSTRPGANVPDAEEEWHRVSMALGIIRREWPEAIVSVDTFRAEIAEKAVLEYGADIINDVAGGTLDPMMFDTIARLRVPYVLMHTRGTPATMQSLTEYNDVTADVVSELAFRVRDLRERGVCDIILDPGFGFAKTAEQNFELMRNLEAFEEFGLPVLVGVSRKSMLWRPLGLSPDEVLPATVSLETFAMLKGADIIRVHDVAPTVQARYVTTHLTSSKLSISQRNVL